MNNEMIGGKKFPLTSGLNQITNLGKNKTMSFSSAFDGTVNMIKQIALKNPYVLVAIIVVVCLIIIFMMINTAAKSNVLQWFIWILLFVYLTFFIIVQFYLVPSNNFNPWASALVASLFIYLFPSPLFNTRKNKSSTQWLSIGYTFLLLLTSLLMINGYTSIFFEPPEPGSSQLKRISFNYILPFVVVILPSFYYWKIFY